MAVNGFIATTDGRPAFLAMPDFEALSRSQ
jgi:hypothetical protein